MRTTNLTILLIINIIFLKVSFQVFHLTWSDWSSKRFFCIFARSGVVFWDKITSGIE